MACRLLARLLWHWTWLTTTAFWASEGHLAVVYPKVLLLRLHV
jgi:hypothetical protein